MVEPDTRLVNDLQNIKRLHDIASATYERNTHRENFVRVVNT